MFKPTDNPYKFKYLVTAITGPGIEEVYLPAQPSDDKILFKKQNKFVRPEPSDVLKKAIKDYSRNIQIDKNYVHPMQHAINAWADQEWDRSTNGIWFWNNGVATFVTPFYYWYLTAWITYFGHPAYRETDKELTYFILYCEEDTFSFGLLLNTIRRYGKSSIMGAWIIYRATRNFAHYAGMQGETDQKIGKFYRQMVMKPFKKLPFYHQPTFDTSSTLSTEIRLEKPAKRGQKVIFEADDVDDLESMVEYRESGEGAYDSAVLHSYLGEEVGKTLNANIYERWDTVKPCLRRGIFIRGKSFQGTTVENMEITGKGGRAYKGLFYDSDFNDRQKDGRTKSGLYACFIPGDCALEGFIDDWGHPMRREAKEQILMERESYKNNPKKLSALIRKYPLYIKEIFYISSGDCEFNSQVLQDRKSEIDAMVEPIVTKGVLEWENKVRFSKVKFRHDPGGWYTAHSLPTDPAELNQVQKTVLRDDARYTPLNNNKIAIGLDPIDHGTVVDGTESTDEYTSNRRSRPVLFVKRKYDSSIDGVLTQELLDQRRDERYPYKTNRDIGMMDVRPNDPNVLFERILLICWYFGAGVHGESNKPGFINYLKANNCGDFVVGKYVGEDEDTEKSTSQDGTPASQMIIQEYTSAIATYVEYFGHTIPFVELLDDLLLFKPAKTKEFDYAVAKGFTELSCKIKPKYVPPPVLEIHDFMPGFDENGNIID
jgi:hypothetical protein